MTTEDRVRIVRLVTEDHRDPQLVAEVFGVSRSSVYEWLSKYRESGVEALSGWPSRGRPAAVTEDEMWRLYALIRGHEPRELGFEAVLWTRRIVGMLVEREFGVRLSQPTVVKILRRIGLHVPKGSPLLGGGLARQDETAIRAKAARAGALLLFAAATRVATRGHDKQYAQDWLLSAVDRRGGARFTLSPSRPDTQRLVAFGTGLLHDCPSPMYVVVRATASSDLGALRAFVESTHGRFGVFLLRQQGNVLDSPEFWGR